VAGGTLNLLRHSEYQFEAYASSGVGPNPNPRSYWAGTFSNLLIGELWNMASKEQKSTIDRVNSWLQTVGPDGQYPRDRIAVKLGLDLNRKWSDSDRKRFYAAIEQEVGFRLPNGLEVDNGGHNLNTNHGVTGKKIAIGAAIGGAALATGGLAGVGPLAALGGGSGAAAGAGTAAATGTGAGTAATTAGVVGAGLKTADIARELLTKGGMLAAGAADDMSDNRAAKLEADVARIEQRRLADNDYQQNQRQRDSDITTAQAQLERSRTRAAQLAQAPSNANRTMLSPYSKSLQGPAQGTRDAASERAAQAQATLDDLRGRPAPSRFEVGDEEWDKGMKPGGLERAAGIGAGVAGVASAVPWGKLSKWLKW
jgi:hypothetical protein